MDINYLQERYVSPYTNFGFKRLFGNETNKDLLISFLNALLYKEQHVVDITYLRNDWKYMFDVYCENDKGEKFIVEMQKAEQQFFKDRSVFYSTFPIREQALRGEWDYKLKAVYTIGILNFVFDENREDENYYHHEIKLMDINKKEVFYDKLTFIYLEMPKFTKTETELETLFDKWMYVLKNLPRLMERPVALQERIFERVFRVAEIAKFNKNELVEYEESLKVFRDLNNVINTAEQKGETRGEARGRAEGRAEGERKKALDIARNLKSSGLPVEDIAKFTGLTLNEISNL
ncbi:Rpn family recombination-promoting nuclease/putative transposase [Butyricimonas sp.]|uniref:Rpn family recombination-promoting nuclease/putative transposase n=1 Tax=Butyricimonas sp. TaxID=1969738 RepID=UPI0025C1866F|nr:Rpn family recombination-promoting nuclease/putative transposase [Butyricimonas sp.]